MARWMAETVIDRRSAVRTVAALAMAPAVLAAGCGRDPRRDSVVIYASADDAIAREAFAACTAATGIEIAGVFDTEATKTTGLENRLRSERNRPRADLFWSSEAFAATRLAADGVLARLPESVVASIGTARVLAGGCAAAFSARARVVVWNTGRLQRGPEFWSDLGADGSPGPIAIADPRFGTTRGHLAALEWSWREARASGADTPTLDAWLGRLRRHGVRMLTGGNAATVEAVVTGECAYGLTDTDDALAAIARGLPVAMCLPRSLPVGRAGGGTMLVPNTLALVQGGPRGGDETVTRVASWFASSACESILCRSASRNLPLGDGAACERAFEAPDPLAFDLDACARVAADTAARAHGILGGALDRDA